MKHNLILIDAALDGILNTEPPMIDTNISDAYQRARNARTRADQTGNPGDYETAAGLFSGLGMQAAAIACRERAEARRKYDDLCRTPAYNAWREVSRERLKTLVKSSQDGQGEAQQDRKE